MYFAYYMSKLKPNDQGNEADNYVHNVFIVCANKCIYARHNGFVCKLNYIWP